MPVSAEDKRPADAGMSVRQQEKKLRVVLDGILTWA